MHSIWHFFDTLPTWAQGTVLASLLAAIGFSLKKLAVGGYSLIHDWLERRNDQKVIRFLRGGDSPSLLDRRSPRRPSDPREIARAINRKPGQVRQSLERLQKKHLVICFDQPSDAWVLHPDEWDEF